MEFPTNFDEERLTFSETAVNKGIDNSLPEALVPNAVRLATTLAFLEGELHREFPGSRLYLSSGYRCPELNVAVGGSATSDHMSARAADIKTTAMPAHQFATWIKSKLTEFDQIILEFGRWVHVSVPREGKAARMNVITAVKRPNKQGKLETVYLQGIVT